jgi:hypothetical protein
VGRIGDELALLLQCLIDGRDQLVNRLGKLRNLIIPGGEWHPRLVLTSGGDLGSCAHQIADRCERPACE